MKFWNALVHNKFGQSQWNFAHVMTVTLSWHVQNFIVIGWAHFKPEHYKFWSNFKFDRNIINGTGAWSAQTRDLLPQIPDLDSVPRSWVQDRTRGVEGDVVDIGLSGGTRHLPWWRTHIQNSIIGQPRWPEMDTRYTVINIPKSCAISQI